MTMTSIETTGTAEVVPVPLSRNRNYTILWTGQLFSQLAMEILTIALPLLILARSGSAIELGLASSALAVAQMAAVVPAGVIADRWDRRKVLLVCAGARAAGMAALVASLFLGHYSFPLVLAVVVLEGIFVAAFDPAEHAALPQVVPASQLSLAVARNTARPYVAAVLGPTVAGFLFALQPAHPFLANAVMLALSFVTLLMLRLPRVRRASAQVTAEAPVAAPAEAAPVTAEAAPEARRSPWAEAAEGFRWVLGKRVIRTTLLWVMLTNFVFGALVVVVLALADKGDVGAAETGLMMGFFGAGGVLGAMIAPRLHAGVPAPVLVLGFSWLGAAGTAAMAFVPVGVPLGLLFGLLALLAPAANTTVMTYQLMVTPDEMRGRLSGLSGFCSGGAGALGPLVGGALVTATGSSSGALLACAGAFALIALMVTVSPTMRRFPAASAA
ncbi:MFS transporter [Streptomyces sp. NBC_00237]|uniref:MFS transporter n=1 Tax=Streptomyces sp. NBC_00237 TaxID=2975687 RepID=UPI00225030E4|nr:MFS transporter [Streptomyces sp. NBC_00237]MCX5206937.1 MFS transporter [Streptomyces sp. NBC_00237]